MSALFTKLTGLGLASPWCLSFAMLVLLGLFLRLRRGAPAILFVGGALLRIGRRGGAGGPGAERRLPQSLRTYFLPLPRTLEVLGLLLGVLALARPVLRVVVPREIEGIDIVLAIDTSSSMTANDLDPARTRLDVAREAAAAFVDLRPHDRIGLVSFARYPDLLCPATLDHDALGRLLAAVGPVGADGPEDATGIGTAVTRAAEILRGGTSPSRVVILLTDGEENVATSETPEEIAPLHAAQFCRECRIRVYTIAVGVGGRGPAGRTVAIDTRQVRSLAESTGGRFFTARDAGGVTGVYAEIDRLERAPFGEPRYRDEEKFMPFLAAALALLLIGRLLGSTLLKVRP